MIESYINYIYILLYNDFLVSKIDVIIMVKEFFHVLVIGNGFDLNLGLKTSYRNFIDSSNFKNLVKDGNILCEYLSKRQRIHEWIDIEKELKIYSKSPMEYRKDKFYEEFIALSKALNDYINSIDYSNINRDSKAYSLLKLISEKNHSIIDFNYTDTVSILLSEMGIKEPGNGIVKVHGSAKKNTIILGVEDKADIRDEDVFLLKTANINYKPCHISEKLDKAESITFFGHSLGETDHHYFESFFARQTVQSCTRKDLNICYCNDIARIQLMKQIRSLTRRNIFEMQEFNDFNMLCIS